MTPISGVIAFVVSVVADLWEGARPLPLIVGKKEDINLETATLWQCGNISAGLAFESF